MEPRRRLADLIRCDVVSFFGLDSGRQVQWFGQAMAQQRHIHRLFPGGGVGARSHDVPAPYTRGKRGSRAISASNRPQLTCRQRELLVLVAAGHTNAQIARRMGLTEGTVRKHLENIYSRLHVSSRTAAVTRAFPRQTAL
jgi:DNA-binding NarL/FixJ family response regulator